MEAFHPDPNSVLVIDDSDIDRETMLEVLRGAGFRAEGLPTPIGATREVRRVQAGVVIIDQNMPVMDGHKLAVLFRENAAIRGIRVVLVSGNEDEEMTRLTREARADAFVSKRDLHRQLASTVRRLCDRSNQPLGATGS